jgi:pilus assembly protein CpaB
MVLRWLLYVMVALSLTGFLGVAWLATRSPVQAPIQAAAPPAARPRVVILAAARPLRAGALLGPDDMAGREIEAPTPEPAPGLAPGLEPGLAPNWAIDTPAARAAVLGGMVRHNLPAGAPLHADSVLRPHDHGFLAAVLEPGTRAVTVGVDPVSGAAGLIWPGDRVDVELTQAADGNGQPPARRVSGETLLAGARVIAIDQQLMQGTVGAEGVERGVRTVTLEVTPAQAERIAVGARLGRLTLAVHASRADPPPAADAAPPGVTWAGDVSAAIGTRSGEALRLYSGPDKTEEMHF